jgi:hypothetical protein
MTGNYCLLFAACLGIVKSYAIRTSLILVLTKWCDREEQSQSDGLTILSSILIIIKSIPCERSALIGAKWRMIGGVHSGGTRRESLADCGVIQTDHNPSFTGRILHNLP